MDLGRDDADALVRDAFYSTDADRLLPSQTALDVLLSHDQLSHRLLAGSHEYFDFPTGFAEQPIAFPPTYKYEPGTDAFESAKRRVPSWCDRVLYKPAPGLVPLCYDYVPEATTSDHRPVLASFAFSVGDPPCASPGLSAPD